MKLWGVELVALFWVAFGGALGSAARFLVSGWVADQMATPLARLSANWLTTFFPWGTLVVNVAGSALIGFIAAISAPEGRWMVSPGARQFLMLGVLGGFTTFSSFSLQTLELLRDGEWFMAGANAVLSVSLCMIGVWLGFQAGSLLNR
jgi:CrcB protein